MSTDSWDDSATGGKTQSDYEELLGESEDKLIITYCGYVKCARSHNAAIWATKLGYTNVKRYAGGIFAWKGAGLPTVSGG
jgi:rhodanese-related sulfurtransferase